MVILVRGSASANTFRLIVGEEAVVEKVRVMVVSEVEVSESE